MPFLIIMLFGVFLQVPIKNLRKALSNKKVTALSLAINFLWTPLLAFGLGRLFFHDSPDVFIALIMDLVTPCTAVRFVKKVNIIFEKRSHLRSLTKPDM